MNFIKKENSIVIFIDNKFSKVLDTQPNYKEIVDAVMKNDIETVKKLLKTDVKELIMKWSDGKIGFTVKDAYLMEDGKAVEGTKFPDKLFAKLKYAIENDLSPDSFINFWKRCLENPDKDSRDQLYDWLDRHEFMLLDNGSFIGFKAVRSDYYDKHTATMYNGIGMTVTMDRDDVVKDCTVSCAPGLHVAAFNYAKGFRNGNDVILTVEVDPRDVVSIPLDYNQEKIRVCKYTVRGQLSESEIHQMSSL